MQTENLTWPRAKNLLLTGMAKVVEFDGGWFKDHFFVKEGQVYLQFRSEEAVPTDSINERKLFDYKFKVVDKPTYK